jgi:hypothetical protein
LYFIPGVLQVASQTRNYNFQSGPLNALTSQLPGAFRPRLQLPPQTISNDNKDNKDSKDIVTTFKQLQTLQTFKPFFNNKPSEKFANKQNES